MLTAPYTHFGGRVAESAALKNLLASAGIKNPTTGKPFSEALCFGLAGGIGAGYSFCPSVVRWGVGSGISIPGRHKCYATGAVWYEGFFQRLGIKTRVTETAAQGKAYQNLVRELEEGRPAVVWCGRGRLGFLGNPMDACNGFMHSFVVHGIDADNGLAFGSDRAPAAVSLSLNDLAQARAAVCSHKNRTLTFDPPSSLRAGALRQAVADAIQATSEELLRGKMKTFSLPGLQTWARMIVNSTSKEGWLKVFQGKLLYLALSDVFQSIEIMDAEGGLHRGLYADFLDEAASITGSAELAALADDYRALARQWTDLAEACLPSRIGAFKQTKALLREQCRAFVEKGDKGDKARDKATMKLRAIRDAFKEFPLDTAETQQLMEGLRERISVLHAAEKAAAEKL